MSNLAVGTPEYKYLRALIHKLLDALNKENASKDNYSKQRVYKGAVLGIDYAINQFVKVKGIPEGDIILLRKYCIMERDNNLLRKKDNRYTSAAWKNLYQVAVKRIEMYNKLMNNLNDISLELSIEVDEAYNNWTETSKAMSLTVRQSMLFFDLVKKHGEDWNEYY